MDQVALRVLREDGEVTVPARIGPDGPTVAVGDLGAAIGWHLDDRGWCQGETCVPDVGAAAMRTAESVTLCDASRALRRAYVWWAEPGTGEAATVAVAVWGADTSSIEGLAVGQPAPPIVLQDLDGRSVDLLEQDGRKRVVVAFSSWCGCRYDLPGWQRLIDGLADDRRGGGVDLIAVAIDESPEDVRPWVEDLPSPVLIDPDRRFCERYGVTNVPTVIWIDEQRRIARPTDAVFADDTFTEFHGVDSQPHHDQLRRWVLDGELPLRGDEPAARRKPADADAHQARAHYRLAVWLVRHGRPDAARDQLGAAEALAPDDFTIWRAGLQLTGGDPFGDDFFTRYGAWKTRTGGRYYEPSPTER